MKYCKDEKVLMQSFLKTAMDELDLSRTKLLVSIRRLIEKERLSKVRSSKDERKIYIYLNDDDISKFNALFEDVVKSRLLCKMLYNVFTISTYQN